MNDKKKVLIIDDQNVARGFFEMYVKMSDGYELSGSLSVAEHALSYCAVHPVDLIIMDVMMKYGLDGLTVAKRIKEKYPEIKVILTTSMAESEWEQEARDAGIESFWYKEYSEEPLTEVMDRTMAGESVYPGETPSPRFGDTEKARLSARELDVLRELTTSCTNEEIAERLGISVNTVRRHIQNMINKTGYESRTALAVNARLLGLVVNEEDRMNARYTSLQEERR